VCLYESKKAHGMWNLGWRIGKGNRLPKKYRHARRLVDLIKNGPARRNQSGAASPHRPAREYYQKLLRFQVAARRRSALHGADFNQCPQPANGSIPVSLT